MNWPNGNLPTDILARLNTKIEEFGSVASDLSGAEGSLEVQKFSVGLFMILMGSEDPRLREELLSKGANWDTEEPELAQIQKYLNRLLSGRLQDAADYFEKSEDHKSSLIAAGVIQAKSQAAKVSAKKRHESNNLTKTKALKFYAANKKKYSNKVEAAYDLAKRFPPLKYETYYKAIKSF